MKDMDRHELILGALRGKLTTGQQAEFDRLVENDAGFRAEWETEQALEQTLRRLPDAPVPSNFTSLVLQAALRPGNPAPSAAGRRPWFRFAFVRWGAGLAAVAAVALTIQNQRTNAQRQEVAEAVHAFNNVASAIAHEQTPATDVFQNFEVIQRLSIPSDSELDMELLAALEK